MVSRIQDLFGSFSHKLLNLMRKLCVMLMQFSLNIWCCFLLIWVTWICVQKFVHPAGLRPLIWQYSRLCVIHGKKLLHWTLSSSPSVFPAIYLEGSPLLVRFFPMWQYVFMDESCVQILQTTFMRTCHDKHFILQHQLVLTFCALSMAKLSADSDEIQCPVQMFGLNDAQISSFKLGTFLVTYWL